MHHAWESAGTGATPHVFFRLELTDVRVDRVSLVGDAEASTGTPLLPTERFFLTAGGATYVYTPISDQGQVGTPVEATVDCAP